jgi:hypothetical protein
MLSERAEVLTLSNQRLASLSVLILDSEMEMDRAFGLVRGRTKSKYDRLGYEEPIYLRSDRVEPLRTVVQIGGVRRGQEKGRCFSC